jgi:hypothetical protein
MEEEPADSGAARHVWRYHTLKGNDMSKEKHY